jgi:beta-RFAP synthase
LHFGLLDTVDPFGGVGLMIDRPRTEVRVTPAPAFESFGPRSSRVMDVAKRVAAWLGMDQELPPCRVEVIGHVPAHCGLGSGTQLAMSVAEGICCCLGVELEPTRLAMQLAARGKRSAVGIHGYFHGGLILEGASPHTDLNAIQQRLELPDGWCVAVVVPRIDLPLVHGEEEVDKFASLPPAPSAAARELKRIACQELMPSAATRDFEAFASAVSRYNHASGNLFAALQGGAYNGPEIGGLVGWLTQRGVSGVGQSSWGPGVFAWFESAEHAEPIVRRLPDGVELITLTHPRNEGRTLRLG